MSIERVLRFAWVALLLSGCDDRVFVADDKACAKECVLAALKAGSHPTNPIVSACIEAICSGRWEWKTQPKVGAAHVD